ncbi:MAG: hypothetical protein FWG19_03710 [Methanomassiliicoccaceae archaeon]|nr:hypothetical protein [Methanomassiliicoccaceae archaeon]
MTSVQIIYTDKRIMKREYSYSEVYGDGQRRAVLVDDLRPRTPFPDGCLVFSGPLLPPCVTLSKELSEFAKTAEKEVGCPFADLKKYQVHGSLCCNYSKKDRGEEKEYSMRALDWLLGLAGDHLRNGAKKFYFASLWYPLHPHDRLTMKKLDIADFKPYPREFSFGAPTVWEFVDSGIND